ncbi:MAG: DNA helicase RecQ [Chitinophagales bacterium]|jgi:ATP-dependent DNA helicase RecQ|nr:DNA helicase RecQ [Bacteroidota bacterium]MBL0278984.1 DNA helicase RecQ [Bacteroidota bacterium]MBP8248827.1 DNA helicase RecQ [Chitinophagales bacterium]MBP9878902.1 DNA helicase RecQ [Chitinophagales bacterium]
MEVSNMTVKEALQEFFGFDSFKGNQEQIIESLLKGQDTFVIMPTGGGKSLCYQLPAMMLEGTAIIVSPLIALMKNQVDLVRGYSSNNDIAHFLNSSLNRQQIKKVKQDITEGRTKMLYVAPETLRKEENIEFFKGIKVSFVGVDEAHCISEWGHDFRPEYRQIHTMIETINDDIPIIALTATATPKVQSDIKKNLGLENPNVFMSSFNRPNLYYEIRPKRSREFAIKQIVKYIKENPRKSGIVYCLNRKSTEDIAKVLNINGIRAGAYHAGMDAQTRPEVQDKFLMEDYQVIVATIAFGMGIDKPDVRFVIHFDIPKSIENYYQETGRAGRDGLEGKCIAFYSYKDIEKLEKFMRDKPLSEREMGAQLLAETAAYAEASVCRRRFLLFYFGEEYDRDNCGCCDNCLKPKEKIEGRDYVQNALRVVDFVKENHHIPYLVDLLTGKKTTENQNYNHDKIELFGVGKEKDEHFWNSILRQCLLNEFILKDIEQYGVIKLTEKGREFIKKPKSVMISLNHDFEADTSDVDMENNASKSVLDPVLMDMLTKLRDKIAKDAKMPPYVIYSENSLEEMATMYPTTMDEIVKISGVSKGKADKYGKQFIDLIAQYVEENEIEKPSEFVMKQVVNKSAHKVKIIQFIDKKMPLPDIAKNIGLNFPDFIDEIETIVTSGTKLSLNYYLNDLIEQDLQEEVHDYFLEMASPDLKTAFNDLKDEGLSFEELRLLHIKFMSEMAN